MNLSDQFRRLDAETVVLAETIIAAKTPEQIMERWQQIRGMSEQIRVEAIQLGKLMPKWFTSAPTKEGMYILMQGENEQLVNLVAGQWQKAQNPQWLYDEDGKLEGKPVREVTGRWYGPV